MQGSKKAIDFNIGEPQIQLLTAALSSDRANGSASCAAWWKSMVVFDSVQGTDASLFPRIYANLGQHIRDDLLRARMKGAARHHWLKNQYLMATCVEVLETLEAAGIPVVLMK